MHRSQPLTGEEQQRVDGIWSIVATAVVNADFNVESSSSAAPKDRDVAIVQTLGDARAGAPDASAAVSSSTACAGASGVAHAHTREAGVNDIGPLMLSFRVGRVR